MGILQDHAQGPAQIQLFDLVDIDVVEADLAVLDIIKAVDQVGDGRLAGAGGTDQGNFHAGFRVQPDIMQDHLVIRVTEIHPVKGDIALQGLIIRRIGGLVMMFPGPAAGMLIGLDDLPVFIFTVDQHDVALVCLGLFIQQAENTLRARQGHDDTVELHGDLVDRHADILGKGQETGQGAHRKADELVEGHQAAHRGRDNVIQVAHLGIDGADDVGIGVRLESALVEILIQFIKVPDVLLLMAEDLDDLLAGHHFLNESVEFTQVLLLGHEVPAGQGSHLDGQEQHQADHGQGDKGQGEIQDHHHGKNTDDGDGAVEELGNTLADHLPQGIDIIGINGHDIAVGVGIKILDGQAFHMVEKLGPQAPQGSLADLDHDPGLGERGQYADQIKTGDPEDGARQGTVIGIGLSDHRGNVGVDQGPGEHGASDIGQHRDHDAGKDSGHMKFIIFQNIAERPLHEQARVLDFGPGTASAAAAGAFIFLSFFFLCHGPPPFLLVEIAVAAGLGFIDLPVNGVVPQQVVGRIEAVHLAVFHDDDPVTVLYAGDPLGDDQLGGIRDLRIKGMVDFGVCGGIAGAGGIIQDQDPGILEQGPGNAEALFLAAGYIGAALFNIGVIAVGQAVNELIGAGQPAGFPAFLLGGVGIAPAQVVINGPAEQNVLLQDNRDLVAQGFHIIVPDIQSAHPDTAFRHIIEAADQVDQAGFGGAGTADDADRFPGPDLQVDILEDRLARILTVGKADMIKFDAAVPDFRDRVLRVAQAALLIDDFRDTVGAGAGHGDHNDDHGDHHQVHQDIHTVGQQTHQVTGGQRLGNDHMGACPADQQDTDVDDTLHDRHDRDHVVLRLDEHLENIPGRPGKFVLFVLLPDKGLDHADGRDILLDALIEGIVFLEDLAEILMGPGHHKGHKGRQYSHRDQIDHRDPGADDEGHDHGHDHGHGSPHGHTQDHLVGVLQVGHIRCQPGDQAGGGEAVNVGK